MNHTLQCGVPLQWHANDDVLMQAHFHTMVESSIDLSVFRVKEYVHAFMSDQIQQAHEKITSYSKLYTDTMTSALNAKSLSKSLKSVSQ